MSTHIYYHLGKIQHRLQRRSIGARIWHKLFPNRTSVIVTLAFIGIIMWLALGAPVP